MAAGDCGSAHNESAVIVKVARGLGRPRRRGAGAEAGARGRRRRRRGAGRAGESGAVSVPQRLRSLFPSPPPRRRQATNVSDESGAGGPPMRGWPPATTAGDRPTAASRPPRLPARAFPPLTRTRHSPDSPQGKERRQRLPLRGAMAAPAAAAAAAGPGSRYTLETAYVMDAFDMRGLLVFRWGGKRRAGWSGGRGGRRVVAAADPFSSLPPLPPPSSVITFFQQVGFASLESGSVRAKNTRNVLLKARDEERRAGEGAREEHSAPPTPTSSFPRPSSTSSSPVSSTGPSALRSRTATQPVASSASPTFSSRAPHPPPWPSGSTRGPFSSRRRRSCRGVWRSGRRLRRI